MAARLASIIGVLLLLLLPPVPSSSSHVKFNLNGKVYPDGYLYVTMRIGEPTQEYNLDVDTGSILTWVQCHIPDCKGPCKTWRQPHPLYKLTPDKLVPRTNPLCQELAPDPNQKTCSYTIKYVNELSNGLLIRDKFTLPGSAHHTMAFGCGYHQSGAASPVDGILGLGRGSAVDLVSQLMKAKLITKDVIGHCISTKGGGFLYIGDYQHSSSIVTWVRMNPKEEHGYYSPVVPGDLHFGSSGGALISASMKVVFDSGSTYTYFDARTYKATEDAVIASLDKSLTKATDNDLTLCWKGPRPFISMDEVKPLFKSFFLVFGHGNDQGILEIPPENYLIITEHRNVCFGILDGSHYPALRDMNLIGAITMQDRIVTYDNQMGKIGWVHDSCKTTKSESVITSHL